MLGNRWKNGKDTVEQKKVKPKYPNRWLAKKYSQFTLQTLRTAKDLEAWALPVHKQHLVPHY